MSIASSHMTSEYDIQPDMVVDLSSFESPNDRLNTHHRHVVIIMEDGSEMWLDISTELKDHNFADIRWFNPDDEMKGIGAFTIVNGARQSFGSAYVKTIGQDRPVEYKQEPLKGTDGNPVTGHKSNGGYCVTLLVDKNGQERAAIKPSGGNG